MNEPNEAGGWRPESNERDRLRDAFRDGPRSSERQAPDADAVWDAATAAATPEQRAQIVDRLAEDPELLLEWQLAQALESERTASGSRLRASGKPAEALATPRAANDNRRQLLVVAATIVTLIAVGLLSSLFRPDPEPVYRSGQSDLSIVAATDSAARCTPGPPCRLTWSVVGDGETDSPIFRITVLTQALDPLLEQSVEQPRFELPAELLRSQIGQTLLWQVTLAEGEAAGGEPLTSPTFTLDVVGVREDSANDSDPSGSNP